MMVHASTEPLPLYRRFCQRLDRCRSLTLALIESATDDEFLRQAHPDFSPVGWHLGHIAYTESLWLIERGAKQPCRYPHYRQLFAADGVPKSERGHLPSRNAVLDYAADIRKQVLTLLTAEAFDSDGRMWDFILQHESQHTETIALVMELHRCPTSTWGEVASLTAAPSPVSLTRALPYDMVAVPAGPCEVGCSRQEAMDNERPCHGTSVNGFWIDRFPVVRGEYRDFIQAGGYANRQWWSEDGWQWLQAHPVSLPRYWACASVGDRHPVCGVNAYEAEAYAAFVGKRLPTEIEWEKAASWDVTTQSPLDYPWGKVSWPTQVGVERANWACNVGCTTPVDSYPAGRSPYGCLDMVGNVWEWTSSRFEGYQGFRSYPYRGYSQTYFDRCHRVLKGGSWATHPWAVRSSFRNWYHPWMRQMLVGFRCASDRKSD